MNRYTEMERILRVRKEEARRWIQKSSGGLIWAGEPGILIIAPNRSMHEDRIHQVHDRIACLMRGTANACAHLWIPAIGFSCKNALELSAGDVFAKDIAKSVSGTLTKVVSDITLERLKAEMTLVQIAGSADRDYLGHIDFEGDIEEFEFVRFFDVNEDEPKENNPDLPDNTRNERLSTINIARELKAVYRPDMPIPEVINMFREYDRQPPDTVLYHIGKILFGDSRAKRIEIALLDRKNVNRKDYEKTFKRL